MQDIINILINIVFTLVSAQIFLDLFLVQKQVKNYRWIPTIMICLWQILIALYPYSLATNLTLSIILITFFAVCVYEGNTVLKCSFSILYITVWILVQFIFMVVDIDVLHLTLYGSITSKILTVILIMLFRYMKRTSRITKYTNRYIWIILVTPVTSLLITYVIFNYNLNDITTVDLRLSAVLVAILVFTNVVVLKVYQLLIREFEIKRNHNLLEQQVELRKEHSQEIELMLNNIRKINHNIKHNYLTLKGYLEENNITEAKQYLEEMINESIGKVSISDTGNMAIDTIVNAKYLRMVEHNISFKQDINIPAAIPFLGVDLSILIGNILENSIEANLRVDEDKRYIELYITYENNYLILTCVNSFNGLIEKTPSGIIQTIKKDKVNHGLGLESIQSICNKYRGKSHVEHSNETFTVKALLFINSLT